jgi:putative transposase
MLQTTYRSVEFKLYLNKGQETTLTGWLRECAWVYNHALAQRTLAYARRKETVSLYMQCDWLTGVRSRRASTAACPAQFERDALRRVDAGMQAFFRRLADGQKPGYPRFKSSFRWNSMTATQPGKYARSNGIRIPNLGWVIARGAFDLVPLTQKSIRIIRRASGWYAQLLFQETTTVVEVPPTNQIGLDVGLSSFATLSTGEKIENPRFFQKSQQKLEKAQRKLRRKKRGSRNRRKACKRVARIHEKIKAQRKDFAHRTSRDLVNRFDLIAIEDLAIRNMAKSKLAKSILDAAWGLFFFYLTYKAAYAGKSVVKVGPRGTSQTCPGCGATKKKLLSERTHQCVCGLVLDRDHASAKVILARAVGVAAAKPACGGSDQYLSSREGEQVGLMKQEESPDLGVLLFASKHSINSANRSWRT